MKRVVAVLALLITIMSASCSVLKSQMIPEPTLTTVESKRLVRDLLENNAGCQLPCWWGITPGKTTWAEARSFLESFALYIGETGAVRVPLPAPYSNATYMDHGYSIKNGIIDIIYIYNYNLAPNYYLPKFLEDYGQPSEIWIRTFSQAEIGQQNFAFDLFYMDKGILIEYGTETPIEDVVVDGKLQNCLNNADSPFIYLWSPEKTKMSFQDAKQKFLDTRNLPEPKPLLEATGMDGKTFYETFKNPDTDICIETPKYLWE
jgi:hypothetical protein